jgi:hypothetical protein
LIPNMSKRAKVELLAREYSGCEGLTSRMRRIINALYSTPWGIPRRSIYRGGWGVR